jgi:hypothetical protein
MDSLLEGTFIEQLCHNSNLNENERSWIVSLQRIINHEVSLQISLDDFKKYFKAKQERTSSSPSRRHMGHYKTMLECIRRDSPLIPDIVIAIAYMSLITATPLQ